MYNSYIEKNNVWNLLINYLKKKKHAKERHPETNTGSKQFKNLHGHHSKCNLLHRFLNSPQIIEVFSYVLWKYFNTRGSAFKIQQPVYCLVEPAKCLDWPDVVTWLLNLCLTNIDPVLKTVLGLINWRFKWRKKNIKLL